MKHLFFFGLDESSLLSSLLEEAMGVALEAAGWFTTVDERTNLNFLKKDK